jgi:hypothetical protein
VALNEEPRLNKLGDHEILACMLAIFLVEQKQTSLATASAEAAQRFSVEVDAIRHAVEALVSAKAMAWAKIGAGPAGDA